jgi:processive 1,2-diacylglycerol beta-glucosyltransferase
MTRVLILTASYGSGHNVAARCLAAAFEREHAQVTVVDHFRELVHPLFDRSTRALYRAVLRRAPFLWGLGYSFADWMASDSVLTLGVTHLGTRRLGALLQRLTPDLVVSVHATPAVALATLARLGARVPPHTTVVTDFVAHSQWIAPRMTAREALGLSTRVPVVLAMAGSQGELGRLPDVARALAAMRRPLQGLVVAGHDPGLKATLSRLTEGTTTRTLGYVSDVRRLMAAADVLVTKAGGMTLAEAMAAETPLLLYGSLPGQERRNERFAARAGIALVARRRAELAPLLARTLDEPELLEHLRARMRRLRRPDAARRIAGAVLDHGVRAR